MARKKVTVEDEYTYYIKVVGAESNKPVVTVRCYEGEHPDLGFFEKLFKTHGRSKISKRGWNFRHVVEKAKDNARQVLQRKKQADNFFD